MSSEIKGVYAIVNGITDKVVERVEGLKNARRHRDALNEQGWRRNNQTRKFHRRSTDRRSDKTEREQEAYWMVRYQVEESRRKQRRKADRRVKDRRQSGPMDARYPRRSFYLSRPAGNRV